MAIQAVTGLMSITGYPDRPPLRVGTPISDYLGGLYAALGILTALHARDTLTGKGQMVDCSMFDATLSVLQDAVAESLLRGEPMKRTGNRHALACPSGAYGTKDRKLVFVTCQTDAQWEAIMNVIGRPDIVARQWNLSERANRGEEIDEMIEAWSSTKTRDEIEALLAECDVVCAPVMDIVEAEKHPHTKAREMFVETQDMFGRISGVLGIVPKLSDTPGETDWGLMKRGAFNKEVYSGLLGYSEEDMAKLKEEGVI